MTSIKSFGTAFPQYAYGPEDICNAGRTWLADAPPEMALFERFVSSALTTRRHFARPVEEMLEFSGTKQRAEIFEDIGTTLGVKSAAAACVNAKIDPGEIDTFIFTSCSAPLIPSIDALMIQKLKLNPSVNRLPMYQHGCAGGVVGLSLANKFASMGHKVLLSSVELCSLGFFTNDHTPGHLVGSAIFGDGSASAVITPEEGGLKFLDSQSVLTENSRHMMGYNIMDDGAHLRLDKELPGFLAKEVPKLVPAFLKRNGLTTEDIGYWLFHPGGVKVLNCLEEAFSIPPEKAIWARDVLRDFGNLSSASVLLVTTQFMNSKVAKPGELALMVGVGPGLTVEMILFQVAGEVNTPDMKI